MAGPRIWLPWSARTLGCARSTPPRSRRATRTTARRTSDAVYHPRYYGAFVLDPDGHNIEVVNHNRG
jgi:hypothetical protein